MTGNKPHDGKEILALVGRLMSHYWTAADTPEMRRAQGEDWLEDLTEFGPSIVEETCRQWRRTGAKRRPLPGDIRSLCIAEQKFRQERADRHRLISGPPDGNQPWTYAERKAALAAQREANREAELANYERLKRLDDELKAQRTGKPYVERTEHVYTAEEMRLGRIAMGLEPDPELERLRAESLERERAQRDRMPAEAAE